MKKKKIKKKSLKNKLPKKLQKEEKHEVLEVDKVLNDIQTSDLNSKLAWYKEQCEKLEKEKEEFRENFSQLNDDRADVIVYLKRIINSNADELHQLRDRIIALQEARESENSQFMNKLDHKESELKIVQEQLMAEINLLNSKLKMMEEFRIQKDELMKKLQLQEETQKQLEIRHQEALRDIEKNFILKKYRLKNEVEEKIIKLSEDFQSIMQLKINNRNNFYYK